MPSFFVHKKAICESNRIGSKTNIQAFSHIAPGACIGERCNINCNVVIEDDVTIGNDVTVESGVQLWNGTHIDDDVYIGPNVTFTKTGSRTIINKAAHIGANATLASGISIGRDTSISPGTVITKDVPPHALVEGNPAQITGYAGDYEHAGSSIELSVESEEEFKQKIKPLNIGSCSLWSLPSFEDMRGDLMVTEFSKDIPFIPKRCFFVHNVPNNKIRGEHAHKQCEQFLVAIHGGLSVVIDDGKNRKEVRLDHPSVGLYMPAKIWGIQYKISKDAVLLVYSSHQYEADDYLREYSEFLAYVSE